MVALRKEQDVLAHRGEVAAAERAAVGGRLEVLRAPELPPARRVGHFFLAAGSGHLTPELLFTTRQLLEMTASPERARATLSTSLETRTT
jgi:hypothetical protein